MHVQMCNLNTITDNHSRAAITIGSVISCLTFLFFMYLMNLLYLYAVLCC